MNYMGLGYQNAIAFCDLQGYTLTDNCNLTAENENGDKAKFLIVRVDNESKCTKRYIVINEKSRIRVTEQLGADSTCAIRYDEHMLVFSGDIESILDGWSVIGI